MILRNLEHWQTQPFIDADGLFTIGYAYPNLIMAEDYNSPGSPYWALKAMLILALPEESAFWQAECEALPALSTIHPIPEAGQIIVHSSENRHAWMLMSGQFDKNNFVNFEQKYCKFAYSSQFGFTLERGRYGLNHAAVDSMLLFSAGDDYYRGRRECERSQVTQHWVRSEWRPWHDVEVTSWLIPLESGHIRIHRVNTPRALNCVEGDLPPTATARRGSNSLPMPSLCKRQMITARWLTCTAIASRLLLPRRQTAMCCTPPQPIFPACPRR